MHLRTPVGKYPVVVPAAIVDVATAEMIGAGGLASSHHLHPIEVKVTIAVTETVGIGTSGQRSGIGHRKEIDAGGVTRGHRIEKG